MAATVSGVLGNPNRLYITIADVMQIFNCSHAKAGKIVKNINDETAKSGMLAFPAGKANKYLFSEKYGIPLADIDIVINNERRVM